jgi:Helicase HerA, central domain
VTVDDERRVLASLQLGWITSSDDVWAGAEVYVPQLHQGRTVREIVSGIEAARRSDPPGLVLEGGQGTGKTQLLGWVRECVQRDGGYFFLITLAHGETFWEGVLEAMLDSLNRPHAGGGDRQLEVLLGRLGELAGSSRTVQAVVQGRRSTRVGLDRYAGDLGGRTGLRAEVRDTARALAMYRSEDIAAQDVARAYFQGDELDAEARAEYGLGGAPGPERAVRHLSQILALTGHSVIALDQLDPLISRAASSPETVDSSRPDRRRDHLVNQVAQGLMGLWEGTGRTLILLACIPNSWKLIQERGVVTVADRFRRPPLTLGRIPNAEVAQAIVEKHLAAQYGKSNVTPPYPSWPVRPTAFATAKDRTPRELLQRLAAHVGACLDEDVVTELTSFDEPVGVPMGAEPVSIEPPDHAELDRRFEQLRAAADVATALDPKSEDLMMPPLLLAGIRAWIAERGSGVGRYEPDPSPSSNPPLHAGVRRIVDEQVDAQIRWAFRAIAHSHPRAVQVRLRRAVQESGIDEGDNVRQLFVLRRDEWPSGPKTRELVEEFDRRGGRRLAADLDDLRTFEALRTLLHDNHPALHSWLVARRKASSTKLLRDALSAEVPNGEGGSAVDDRGSAGGSAADGGGLAGGTVSGAGPPEESRPDVPAVSVGTGENRTPFWLELASLCKHVAVFAGSGSGKTVLLRRLVEECALHGISSIVLDPNNDLARLGDPWPEPPSGWRDGDAERAREYLENTDVVVWTPMRERGRPLTFQPLPDFASVLDDADEFRQAVDIAVAALAPRAGASGRTTKAERQRAVLHEALEHFARHGAGSFRDFIDVLQDLPAHASTIPAASTTAADMAHTLLAARINDPLFGGRGEPADPAVLLTPAEGKRARISVISFIGVNEGQRPGFVSQLQMALFAWFKRHPAADRPLGGLLVMDEAQTLAPSGAATPSTESTLILASQARKYGLGLVFATQAPKALHNRIPGNAATQFFGYLNSPAQINTARELAQMKGGDVTEISRLRSGEFYVAIEGSAFRRIRTSNCLSHHPPSPLSTDEVIARARRPNIGLQATR